MNVVSTVTLLTAALVATPMSLHAANGKPCPCIDAEILL
jgi:hypothetical protein